MSSKSKYLILFYLTTLNVLSFVDRQLLAILSLPAFYIAGKDYKSVKKE